LYKFGQATTLLFRVIVLVVYT